MLKVLRAFGQLCAWRTLGIHRCQILTIWGGNHRNNSDLEWNLLSFSKQILLASLRHLCILFVANTITYGSRYSIILFNLINIQLRSICGESAVPTFKSGNNLDLQHQLQKWNRTIASCEDNYLSHTCFMERNTWELSVHYSAAIRKWLSRRYNLIAEAHLGSICQMT